ncbi:hypothetical protein TRVL_09163 [Trypanosoma vivax]|nr:hypothetical protein TRVL_09163 [Trypanosoma vivax]
MRVACGNESRTAFQGEAHVVSLALSSFAEAMPRNLHNCTNDTTAMNIMKKGNAHFGALVRESPLIDKALQEQGVRASCAFTASAENPTDGISCGNMLGNVDIARGRHMRGGARKAR